MKNNVTLAPQKLQLYARQWGAKHVPFQDYGQEGWLDTPETQRAWSLLDQSAVLRSLMLLAGPNGIGKSALAGRWLRQLDQRLFYPVALTHASLTGSSILASLTLKLAKAEGFRRERNLQLIEQALDQLEGKTLVIIMDEAQNYSFGALEEIRLLLGLNLAEKPAFALILIGDDYLLGTLKLRHHRALYSRISCHHQLNPWTPPQIAQYLQRQFQAAGLNPSLIEPGAQELLSSASAGIPRSLCLLARNAWIEAASQSEQRITAAHVQKAIDQTPFTPGLQLPHPSQP